jgi:hypothetical protein
VEEMIMALAEKSVIAAGFFLLLYMYATSVSRTNEKISDRLIEFGGTLKDISNTLSNMDIRMAHLEQRVSNLEVTK